MPGNEAWSGYLIEFWDLVVQDINLNFNQFFNFTFYNSPDGLDGNADLAVADFTITALRCAGFRFLRS